MSVINYTHNPFNKPTAVLLLENGDTYWGYGFGAKKQSIGELGFEHVELHSKGSPQSVQNIFSSQTCPHPILINENTVNKRIISFLNIILKDTKGFGVGQMT